MRIIGRVLKTIHTGVDDLVLVVEDRAIQRALPYRKEIVAGLRYARRTLRERYGDSFADSNDMAQIVDIEIWRAIELYKGEMNGGVAYAIAKNQAARFIRNQIIEQNVFILNQDDTPSLDEFRQPKKMNRFVSIDDKELDEGGEPRETSDIENEISQNTASTIQSDRWFELMLDRIPLLEILVNTWTGPKRLIGRTLLTSPTPPSEISPAYQSQRRQGFVHRYWLNFATSCAQAKSLIAGDLPIALGQMVLLTTYYR